MSGNRASDTTGSKDELTEALAEATDSSVADIEAGADEFEVDPPWDADVVE
jgi:hypothetical protein